MSKIPIYYYSYLGNNRNLALTLAKMSNLKTIEIMEKRKRRSFTFIKDMISKNLPEIIVDLTFLENSTRIILITPIWFGVVPKPVLKFILQLSDLGIEYDLLTIRGGQSDDSISINNSIKNINASLPNNFYDFHVTDYYREPIKDIKKVKLNKQSIYEIATILDKKMEENY